MGKNINNEINEVRAESANINKVVGDRIAVIIKTFYTERKYSVGVQFWNESMIAHGISVNNDGTTSNMICSL